MPANERLCDRPDGAPFAGSQWVHADADALADWRDEKACKSQVFGKRLMGFEPTTFCMASSLCGDADCPDIPANGRFYFREQPPTIPAFHREITGVWGLKAD
jgi:hypothetical protein